MKNRGNTEAELIICPKCSGYVTNDKLLVINQHTAYKIARALKRWGYIGDDELESVAEMLRGFKTYK